MGDVRNWSHEFLREFIDIYRANTCLWRIKSREYSNRHLKEKSYAELVKKLKEINESATKEDVIKKINSIRGSFRKEYRKVQQSKKSGAGVEDIYKPNLWYYELVMFLKDEEEVKSSRSNIDEKYHYEFLDGFETVSIHMRNNGKYRIVKILLCY